MKYKIKKYKTWFIVYGKYWFWLNRYYRRIDWKKFILNKKYAENISNKLNKWIITLLTLF